MELFDVKVAKSLAKSKGGGSTFIGEFARLADAVEFAIGT